MSKSFDKVNAVNDVTITIADGEFFTLLGPSGCGKTTTLRMIAGLERPTSGRVFIGDRDVTELAPKTRNIAMVFQNYALYPHMTVAENIGYPLRIRSRARKDIEARTVEVARNLAISDLIHRRPAEISGGQQQRAALARAIIHEPNVFLFDEPLSNLDAKLRTDARTFLKHLQQTLGITTVYVTHDQSEAMAMSDRIAVMDKGRVVQVGPPLEVHRHPANTFDSEGAFRGRWDSPQHFAEWVGIRETEATRRAGLDFIAVTEHNTVSALSMLDALGRTCGTPPQASIARPLVIPGMEFTTFYGHAVAIGVSGVIPWHDASRDGGLNWQAAEVHRQGGIFSIAHPFSIGYPVCAGCEWEYENAEMKTGSC